MGFVRLLWLVVFMSAAVSACVDRPSGRTQGPLDAGLSESAMLARLETTGDSSRRALWWRAIAEQRAKDGDVDGAVAAWAKAEAHHRSQGNLTEAARDARKAFRALFGRSRLLEALTWAERAYEAGEASKDPLVRYRSLNALISILIEFGDDRALDLLLAAAETKTGPDEHQRRALIANARGNQLNANERYELAKFQFLRAIEEAEKAKAARLLRPIRLNLATSYLELGDHRAAEAQLELVEPMTAAPKSASQYYWRAWLLQVKGRPKEALAIVEEALEADVVLRWRFELAVLRGAILEDLDRTDGALAAYASATAYAGQIRTEASGLSLLASVDKTFRAPLEATVRLHLQAGRVSEALMVAENAKGRVFAEAYVRARVGSGDSVTLARRRVEELNVLLPALSARPSQPAKTAVQGPEAGSVLFYLRAKDKLTVFVLHGQVKQGFILETPYPQIKRLASQFEAEPGDEKAASALGRALIPDQAKLPSSGPLYVITDEVLGRIPFAGLIRNGERLMARYEIAYVPNLAALVAARRRPERGSDKLVLAGASDLPGFREEAQWVARHMNAEAITGTDATRARVRLARSADLLHLATHGELVQGRSRIYLADGVIGPADILRDRLAPRLVVLASCASAARDGQELWGSVAAAFLAAGAETVVASLWSVPDRETLAFMKDFYAQGGFRAPRRALAQAQRRALTRGAPIAVWASFVALGR